MRLIKQRKFILIRYFSFFLFILFSFASPLHIAASAPPPQKHDHVTFDTGMAYITTKAGEKHSFTVEIASNPDQWAQGLMYRKTLDAMSGMLFLFPKEKVYSMWMKNTYIPLDILFIRKDGTIATIAQNTIPESHTSIPSTVPVFYALELNAGTTQKLGIKPEDKMTFDPYVPYGQ